MFAHRTGQKRFSTFAHLFFLSPRRGFSIRESRAHTHTHTRARVPLIEFLIDNGNRFDLLSRSPFSLPHCVSFFTGRHYASRSRIFPFPHFLRRCPRLFFPLPSFLLSLSLSFFLSCSRCAVPRALTYAIEGVRPLDPLFSFHLREYRSNSSLPDRRSSSFVLGSRDRFVFILLFFSHCFIYSR